MRISTVIFNTMFILGLIVTPGSYGQETTAIDERSSKICKRQYESRDFPRALKNCSKAARTGDARSYLILGLMYKAGLMTYDIGVVKYPELAYKSFVKAAELGNAQAHYLVGMMLINGDGVEEGNAEAEVWIQKASDMGYHPKGR